MKTRPERYRPAWSFETLVLHTPHVLLTALVMGLLAGPRWPWLVAALVVAAVTVGVVRRSASLLCAGVAVAALAGAVVADARLAVLDRTALRPADDARVRGIVAEAPRTRAFGVRVVAVDVDGGDRILVRVFPRTTLPELEIGREVVVAGRLRRLRGRERFERRRGVHAILEADAVRRTGRWRLTPLDHVRQRAERALAAGLGAQSAALARGMVLGQDHALPADLRDAFRSAGLSHLLAASGQNVMLLAALVIGLGALTGIEQRLRLALALAAIVAYVPIAGAGPSIQRAGVMGAAGLVAAMAGRPATRWYALLLAAALTLGLNPRAAEEPGWQLSFAAVIAILALHRRMCLSMTARGVPRPLAEAAALTVAATLGTAPLIALHFGEISLVSVPANVLAAPAVAPVMWLGTLSGVLGGDLARFLGAVAAIPLAYLAWLARVAASMPHATIGAALPGPLAAVALYVAIALAALARRSLRRATPMAKTPGLGRPRRGVVVAWLAAAGGALLLLAPAPARPPAGFAVTALAVGQGDAILLQHGLHAVLFDAGPPGSPVVGELRKAGVRRLDAFVITHSSADHGGGAQEVLDAMPVGLVADGRKGPGEHERGDGGDGGGERFDGVPRTTRRLVPEAGQHVRAGPIDVEILWPPPGAPRAGDPNLTATVAVARSGGRAVLLTADAESAVTLPLDLPDVDVLKVAHHGSKDEGLPALLAETRPEHALVPVGENTYGHPAPATLRALEAAVPDVRRTDEDGTSRVDLR